MNACGGTPALRLSSSCYVTNCIISGNNTGGGVRIQEGYSALDNCMISNNYNSTLGDNYYGLMAGGVSVHNIYLNGGLVRNCLIHHNTNVREPVIKTVKTLSSNIFEKNCVLSSCNL